MCYLLSLKSGCLMSALLLEMSCNCLFCSELKLPPSFVRCLSGVKAAALQRQIRLCQSGCGCGCSAVGGSGAPL